MNIQSAIIEGTKILTDKSINSAKLDSEILLASAIDQDRKYIILNNDQNIKEENLKYFQKLINKRSFREPIAYLTNEKYFWKYKFFMSFLSIYGGFDTIKSNFLLNIFSNDCAENLILLANLCLIEFFVAIEIASLEISTPKPIEFFKLINKLTRIHPEPVPISKIEIFLFL